MLKLWHERKPLPHGYPYARRFFKSGRLRVQEKLRVIMLRSIEEKLQQAQLDEDAQDALLRRLDNERTSSAPVDAEAARCRLIQHEDTAPERPRGNLTVVRGTHPCPATRLPLDRDGGAAQSILGMAVYHDAAIQLFRDLYPDDTPPRQMLRPAEFQKRFEDGSLGGGGVTVSLLSMWLAEVDAAAVSAAAQQQHQQEEPVNMEKEEDD